jgi:hypothetical protein
MNDIDKIKVELLLIWAALGTVDEAVQALTRIYGQEQARQIAEALLAQNRTSQLPPKMPPRPRQAAKTSSNKGA